MVMASSQQLLKNLQTSLAKVNLNLSAFATNMESILAPGKLAELNLEGNTDGDRLKNLIYLPVDKGGLGTDMPSIDHLLAPFPNVQSELRKVYNTRDKKDTSIPGVEVSLDAKESLFNPSPEAVVASNKEIHERLSNAKTEKEEAKLDDGTKSHSLDSSPQPKKSKKKPAKRKDSPVTDVQVSRDNASERAKEAIPLLKDLIGEKLVNKSDVGSLGKKIKAGDENSPKAQELKAEQERVARELQELVTQYGGNLAELSDTQKREFKAEAKSIIKQNTSKPTTIKLGTASEIHKQLQASCTPDILLELGRLLLADKSNVTEINVNKAA